MMTPSAAVVTSGLEGQSSTIALAIVSVVTLVLFFALMILLWQWEGRRSANPTECGSLDDQICAFAVAVATGDFAAAERRARQAIELSGIPDGTKKTD